MLIKKRPLLKMMGTSGAMALAGTLPAIGQAPKQFNLLAVPAHEDMLRAGKGGDVVSDWEKQNNVQIQWLTFAEKDLSDRLFRELSLSSTTIDASFLFNPWASPDTMNLLEPLGTYMASDPIEDFDDFFPQAVKTLSEKGTLYAVPIRGNVGGLHYNEVFFRERGLTRPPESMEELIEYAAKLTYIRPDGTPVVGMVFPDRESNYSEFVRGWNADYIDENYNVVANSDAMIAAVTALQGMYQSGSLPHQFTTLSDNDNINWMQTGRAAMTVTTMARYAAHNDPKISLFPGKIAISTMPVANSLKGKFDIAPEGLSYWSLIIPKNSQNKKLAWSFINHLANKDSTMQMALNGNVPMRRSTYDDQKFIAATPYAKAEQHALETARVVLPAFNKSPAAEDVIKQQMEAAILGVMTPKQAMDQLVEQLKPLVSA